MGDIPTLKVAGSIDELRDARSLLQRGEADRDLDSSADVDSPEDWSKLRDAIVMIVDDEPINIEVTQIYLEEAGYSRFVSTNDPAQTVALLSSEHPDILLLDLMMPGISGFDILREMRATNVLKDVPTIVLTSSSDAATKLKALELGAIDFLSKPVDPSELMLRVRNTLAAKAYRDRLANYDLLTGLPNRRTFVDRLDWALKHAARYSQSGAVLHVDLDGFKQINNALGPAFGDQLLKVVADRIGTCVRTTDTLGRVENEGRQPSLSRLAGDEFMVLLPIIAQPDSAARVAQRVLEAIAEPISLAGQEVRATCGIGISTFPQDGGDVDSIIRNAGVAMHHAKRLQTNSYQYYSSKFNALALQKLKLGNELAKALERHELCLFYQPKIDVQTGQVCGAEALARWRHPERGLVSPAEFIPLAEETGLIIPLGEWALKAACSQIKAWQSAGVNTPRISVNVSSHQFRQGSLANTLQGILTDSGVDASLLVVEITEGVLMDNAKANVKVLDMIKTMGVRLSMDDFGTGYSSLSYLHSFPLDEIKIDRSFVSELKQPGDQSAIITAIIAMGHSLGLNVTAEGVETEYQLEFLKQQGCDDFQGFLVSKPVPPEEFATKFLPGHGCSQVITGA